MISVLVRLKGIMMVDPISISLGVVAARLLAKIVEKGIDKAANGAVDAAGGLLGWLRSHMSTSTALEKVVEVPDSPSRVATLGEVIDAEIVDDEDLAELRRLVDGVKENHPSVYQSAVGNHIIQASHSTVNVKWSEGDSST